MTIWHELTGDINARSSDKNLGVEEPPERDAAEEESSSPSSPLLKESDESSSEGEKLLSKTSHFKYGEIDSMDVIEKSPFEPNMSAETAEPMFEKLKALLMSKEEKYGEAQDMMGIPTLTTQEETVRVFGEKLAEAFTKAYYVIGRSGVLFSPGWVDQKECKIRNVKCGWVPKNMMLLLLQHQRFARANDVDLQSVVNTLGVMAIFFEALKAWDLNEPKLRHSEPTMQFKKGKKKESLKCIIFIARAYRCSKILKRGVNGNGQNHSDNEDGLEEKEPRLYAKIQQCLNILNDNVQVNEAKLAAYIDDQDEQFKEESRKIATKEMLGNIENKKRRRGSNTIGSKSQKDNKRRRTSLKSLGSTVSSTSSPTIAEMETPNMMREGSQGDVLHRPRLLQPADEDDVPSFSTRTEELLARAESKHKQLGRVIKKLKREIQQERQELKNELRQEILREIEEERLSTSKQRRLSKSNSSKKSRSSGLKI